MLGPYHSLCPLEEPSAEQRPSQVFGMRTAMFKGISVADGAGYALRRIDGRQVDPHQSAVLETPSWVGMEDGCYWRNGFSMSIAISRDSERALPCSCWLCIAGQFAQNIRLHCCRVTTGLEQGLVSRRLPPSSRLLQT